MSHKCYHKNKACCILMGIKIFAKKICILLLSMYAWIKLTKEQILMAIRSKWVNSCVNSMSKFSWELEQKC